MIPSDYNIYKIKKDSPVLQQMLYDTDYEVIRSRKNGANFPTFVEF